MGKKVFVLLLFLMADDHILLLLSASVHLSVLKVNSLCVLILSINLNEFKCFNEFSPSCPDAKHLGQLGATEALVEQD